MPYNEEDWAARARAWAESAPSTENHNTPIPFPPHGRMESQGQGFHDPFQQASGPSGIHQASYSTRHQMPISTQANHVEDFTPFNSSDLRMQYHETRAESLAEEVGTTQSHGNFGSRVFQEEVSSSYSSSSGNVSYSICIHFSSPIYPSQMIYSYIQKVMIHVVPDVSRTSSFNKFYNILTYLFSQFLMLAFLILFYSILFNLCFQFLQYVDHIWLNILMGWKVVYLLLCVLR